MDQPKTIGLLFTVLGALLVMENSSFIWGHYEGQLVGGSKDSPSFGCSIANIVIGIIQALVSYHLYKRDATLRRWFLINTAILIGLLITFAIPLSKSLSYNSHPRFDFYAGLDFFILAVIIFVDFIESQNFVAF